MPVPKRKKKKCTAITQYIQSITSSRTTATDLATVNQLH